MSLQLKFKQLTFNNPKLKAAVKGLVDLHGQFIKRNAMTELNGILLSLAHRFPEDKEALVNLVRAGESSPTAPRLGTNASYRPGETDVVFTKPHRSNDNAHIAEGCTDCGDDGTAVGSDDVIAGKNSEHIRKLTEVNIESLVGLSATDVAVEFDNDLASALAFCMAFNINTNKSKELDVVVDLIVEYVANNYEAAGDNADEDVDLNDLAGAGDAEATAELADKLATGTDAEIAQAQAEAELAKAAELAAASAEAAAASLLDGDDGDGEDGEYPSNLPTLDEAMEMSKAKFVKALSTRALMESFMELNYIEIDGAADMNAKALVKALFAEVTA